MIKASPVAAGLQIVCEVKKTVGMAVKILQAASAQSALAGAEAGDTQVAVPAMGRQDGEEDH